MFPRHHELRRLQLTGFPCHLHYHVRADGDVFVVGAHASAEPTRTLAQMADRL
jgi:hypothetical protein